MKRFTRISGILVSAVAFAAISGAVWAQDDTNSVVSGISMVSGDLLTIDPALSETSSQIEAINQMFVGITAQNVVTAETGSGLASDYTSEVQDDGTVVYTFTLMNNVPWVRYNADADAVEQIMDENGEPYLVTAQDVVYGMLRSLAPETASPYAYVLAPYIVGGAEYNGGAGTAEDVAVVAVDEFTLQITAPDGASFTPSIYGLWMSRPQPEWAIEEGGDSWTEPEYIATNGPFALKEWNHDVSLTLIKNPFWPGSDTIPQAQLDEVTLMFLDPAQQFTEYQAGNLDAIQVPPSEVVRVQADPVLSQDFVTGANPCTYYIGFDNTEDGPSGNRHFRRALSMAIDRQAIVENVLQGGQTVAGFFTYPGLNAAPQVADYPGDFLSFDAEAAVAEMDVALADMGVASVADLGQLTFNYNDTSSNAAIAQAVQQMWSDTFGLQITLQAQDNTTYFDSLSNDAPPIYRAGWCQDYSDANNFMYDVFFSEASQNDTGFANADFDALVVQARLEGDLQARRDLYAQAERILVEEETAIAPVYHYVLNLMVRQGVERADSITGNEAYYLWSVNN